MVQLNISGTWTIPDTVQAIRLTVIKISPFLVFAFQSVNQIGLHLSQNKLLKTNVQKDVNF